MFKPRIRSKINLELPKAWVRISRELDLSRELDERFWHMKWWINEVGGQRIQIPCLFVLAGSFLWVVGRIGKALRFGGSVWEERFGNLQMRLGFLKNKGGILARRRLKGFKLRIEGKVVVEDPMKVVVRLKIQAHSLIFICNSQLFPYWVI